MRIWRFILILVILLGTLSLPLTKVQPAEPSPPNASVLRVVVIDNSRSNAPNAVLIRTDVNAFLNSQQDGTRIRIILIDAGVQPIFSGTLDSTTRAEAMDKVTKLRYGG